MTYPMMKVDESKRENFIFAVRFVLKASSSLTFCEVDWSKFIKAGDVNLKVTVNFTTLHTLPNR